MGIKQLYKDNLRKLPNEYGDVSVMGQNCALWSENNLSVNLPISVHFSLFSA